MDRIIILSDQQARFHDPQTIRAVNKFVEDFQPHTLVNAGDLFDFEALSNYRKSQDAKTSVMRDWSAGRAILRKQRGILPEARIVLIEGNHEARLHKYLLDNAPALSEVPSLDIPYFLGLQDFDIEYVEPYGAGIDWHGVLIYHGGYVRKHSAYTARAEYEEAGTSGVSGHTHRLGAHYHTDRTGSHAWFENGCLCVVNRKGEPPSERGPRINNWQQGFTYGYFDKGIWSLFPVSITKHKFIVESKVYEP